MQVTTSSTAPQREINAETARAAGGFFDHYGQFYLVDDEDFIVTIQSDCQPLRLFGKLSDFDFDEDVYRLPRPGETVTLTF